jgi:hypothetical protein
VNTNVPESTDGDYARQRALKASLIAFPFLLLPLPLPAQQSIVGASAWTNSRGAIVDPLPAAPRTSP